MRPRVRIPAGQRGAAMIEFAFVLVLILSLLFGIIDLSRGFGLKHRAAALSRETANLASRGTELDEALDTIVSAAKPVDLTAKGGVVLSRLEKETADGGFVITEQKKRGVRASRIGAEGEPPSVPIPNVADYPAGSVLFAGEVFIDLEPATPFGALTSLVLTSEVYESAVFYGSGTPQPPDPPGGDDDDDDDDEPPPPPPPPPPSIRPLREETPSPLALARISPVLVSTMRTVTATVALPFLVPTLPTPNLPPPQPPPPTFMSFCSVPNFVMDPTRRYFTPRAFPSFATFAALGSARSLFEKFCSARRASRRFRSITR